MRVSPYQRAAGDGLMESPPGTTPSSSPMSSSGFMGPLERDRPWGQRWERGIHESHPSPAQTHRPPGRCPQGEHGDNNTSQCIACCWCKKGAVLNGRTWAIKLVWHQHSIWGGEGERGNKGPILCLQARSPKAETPPPFCMDIIPIRLSRPIDYLFCRCQYLKMQICVCLWVYINCVKYNRLVFQCLCAQMLVFGINMCIYSMCVCISTHLHPYFMQLNATGQEFYVPNDSTLDPFLFTHSPGVTRVPSPLPSSAS